MTELIKLTGQDGFDAEIPHKPAADLVHLQQRLRPIQQVVRREEHLNSSKKARGAPKTAAF